jgi:uncharacterized protein (DUF433 family)
VATTECLTQAVPLVKLSGVWHVTGTRVPLDSIIFAYKQGATPEEISEQFTSVALGDVYAVIAYYLHNQEEVDRYLAQRAAQRAETRREIESRWDPTGVRDRLLARHPYSTGD